MLMLCRHPQHDVPTTTVLHSWDGLGQVMTGDWLSPDITYRIKAKQFNLGFISPENLVPHSPRVLQDDLQTLNPLSYVLHEGEASIKP